MASKLARVTHKIFGSTPGGNQVGVYGSLAATGTPAYATDPATAMSRSNWLTGWFSAIIGGSAPCVEDENAVDFVHSYQLGSLFQDGVAQWDAGTNYFVGSMANVAGSLYACIGDNSGAGISGTSPASDPVNWRVIAAGEPTGAGKDFWGSSLPSGYVWASGRTIGNASSNATERANADTQALFTMFWNQYTDSQLPLLTTAGAPTPRGSSAAADFAANKQMTIIDMRGRTAIGKDDMGGTAANRVTAANGLDGKTLGTAAGEQTHVLTNGEMPIHNHSGLTGTENQQHTHTIGGATQSSPQPNNAYNFMAPAGSYPAPSSATTGTENSQHNHNIPNDGGGLAHNNMQPSIVCNYIIKL